MNPGTEETESWEALRFAGEPASLNGEAPCRWEALSRSIMWVSLEKWCQSVIPLPACTTNLHYVSPTYMHLTHMHRHTHTQKRKEKYCQSLLWVLSEDLLTWSVPDYNTKQLSELMGIEKLKFPFSHLCLLLAPAWSLPGPCLAPAWPSAFAMC